MDFVTLGFEIGPCTGQASVLDFSSVPSPHDHKTIQQNPLSIFDKTANYE